MSIRAKYVLYYILNIAAAAIVFLTGLLLVQSAARDKAVVISVLYTLSLTLCLLGGFLVNFWYGGVLGLPVRVRVLAGLLHGLGFLYLLGYDKNLLSAKEIIVRAWNLYVQNWRVFLPYLILLLLPSLFVYFLGVVAVWLSSAWPRLAIINNVMIMALTAASLVFTFWFTVALTRTIKALLSGEPAAGWRRALTDSSHLIWPALWASALAGLAILGGTILFIVPGIIFTVWLAFVFYAAALDDQRGRQALTTSKALTVGRWWAIAWRLTAPALLFGALFIALTDAVGWTAEPLLAVSAQAAATVRYLTDAIFNVLIIPLSSGAMVIIYLDAKKSAV